MAFVHEIKFFKHDDQLFSALFEASTRYSSDHWIKNIPAKELGIEKLPDQVSLEQKYSVEELGIKPFFYYATVPKLEFIDPMTASNWKT
ncbi:MAG TPA: hypothetical protein V6D19_03455 [Stenomitos sp.]